MEDCQYKLSNQCNTSTDLVNVKVAVKKEDSLENSEDFSTNSALCDMELKSEEGFSRDIKPEMIESEPTEELATEFFGDSQSGMNDVQHDVIEELVMKKELPSSADAHSEYDIPLTESDEAGVHFEHVKIEKIELGESELLYPCEVCKKVFVDEKDLIEHKSGKIDCIALEVDENEWNKEETLSQDFGEQLPQPAPNNEKVEKEVTIKKSSTTKSENKQSEHMKTHGVKPFAHISNFRTHQHVHTGKRFNCRTCSKSYLNRSSLYQHEKGHRRKGPFKCKLCSISFELESHLSEHERIHKAEKQFHCKFYRKSFRDKDYL